MVQAAGARAVADRYRILLAQCSMQSMTNYGSTSNVIDHKRPKPIFLLTAEMTPPFLSLARLSKSTLLYL